MFFEVCKVIKKYFSHISDSNNMEKNIPRWYATKYYRNASVLPNINLLVHMQIT